MREPLNMPELGEVIGARFRLDAVIGQGAVGRVYEATQLNLDRPVALKVLLPKQAAQQDARPRFEREARVAAALKHPNAVEIYDFGEDRGWLFLAMERLKGTTLRDATEDQAQSAEQVLPLAMQIADALVGAHRIGLVHRDLKPDNIFLEVSDGGAARVVVVDFGLAFIEDREDAGRMTREGVLSGTPAYIAPEQARALPIGPAADVYAFGCVLYELLSGELPFVEESEVEIMLLHIFGNPTPLGEAAPGQKIPPLLEELVMEMLSKQPAERPRADVVLERLQQIAGGASAPGRGRGQQLRLTREDRAVAVPSVSDLVTLTGAEAASGDEERFLLAVVGELGQADGAALALSGLEARQAEADALPPTARAVFAPGADEALLRRLAQSGLPVLSDAEPADFERLEELLSAGVDEVVLRPVRVEELSRRTWRAIRKKSRTRR